LEKGMTIIMDNAIFHKSETTRELIKQAGCFLLFLPPYSPELNPIEQTWANLKRMRKTYPKSSLDEIIALSKCSVS
jgi:transposase